MKAVFLIFLNFHFLIRKYISLRERIKRYGTGAQDRSIEEEVRENVGRFESCFTFFEYDQAFLMEAVHLL